MQVYENYIKTTTLPVMKNIEQMNSLLMFSQLYLLVVVIHP